MFRSLQMIEVDGESKRAFHQVFLTVKIITFRLTPKVSQLLASGNRRLSTLAPVVKVHSEVLLRNSKFAQELYIRKCRVLEAE